MRPGEGHLGDVQRRIRRTRVLRRGVVALIVADAFEVAATLAVRPAFALLAAALIVAGLLLACLETRIIRRLRREEARLLREARPRPDYDRIAAMERAIWGRAFRHEGAPDGTSGDGA